MRIMAHSESKYVVVSIVHVGLVQDVLFDHGFVELPLAAGTVPLSPVSPTNELQEVIKKSLKLFGRCYSSGRQDRLVT